MFFSRKPGGSEDVSAAGRLQSKRLSVFLGALIGVFLIGTVISVFLVIKYRFYFSEAWGRPQSSYRPNDDRPSLANTYRMLNGIYFDAAPDSSADLTLSEVPLSYGYLLAVPESPYSQTIRNVSDLVAKKGGALTLNLQPAELAGYDPSMTEAAACLSYQSREAFYRYHLALLSGGRVLGQDDVLNLVRGDRDVNWERFEECFFGTGLREAIMGDWDPETLSGREFMRKVYAEGGFSLDVVDLCFPEGDPGRLESVPSCLEDLLGKIEVYGSLDTYRAHLIESYPGLSLEDIASISESEVYLSRKEGSGFWVLDLFDYEGNQITALELPGDIIEEGAGVWLEDNEVFILDYSLTHLLRVDLKSGKVVRGILREWSDKGQGRFVSLTDLTVSGFVSVTCGELFGQQSFGDCWMALYDREAVEFEAKHLDMDLRMYEGIHAFSWNEENRTADILTLGGDAGTAYWARYGFDFDQNETETVEYVDPFYSGCIYQEGRIDPSCSKEELAINRRFDEVFGSVPESIQSQFIPLKQNPEKCSWSDESDFQRPEKGVFLGCFQP